MRPSLACQAAQRAGAPGQRAHHGQTSVGGQTLHSPPHVVQVRSGTKGRETLLTPGVSHSIWSQESQAGDSEEREKLFGPDQPEDPEEGEAIIQRLPPLSHLPSQLILKGHRSPQPARRAQPVGGGVPAGSPRR